MKKVRSQISLLALVLILFSACDNNRVFEEYKEVPQWGWEKDSLMVFEIPITDTLQNHNLYINVRNNVDYKYSNLWLFIKINQPGQIAVTDTFELALAFPNGKWLGDGFGGIKTQQVSYKSNVFFPVSGNYKIDVQHGMREELLEGITDIGFRVEKAE
ncbi:MAG: gliding motility lipoprotein GldH [Bacteroidetes bacterium]|nr:gliding motility lipoprotein GldH [Bacteroidota bacterium]